MPCILATDPTFSCVFGYAWAIVEVLTCLLMLGAVVAFAWIHLDQSVMLRRVRRYFKSEDSQ